jgi:hypothetical protein
MKLTLPAGVKIEECGRILFKNRYRMRYIGAFPATPASGCHWSVYLDSLKVRVLGFVVGEAGVLYV